MKEGADVATKSFKTLFIILALFIGFTLGALAGILYMQNLSWDESPVFLESKSSEIFNDVQKIEVYGDGTESIDADIYRLTVNFPKPQSPTDTEVAIDQNQFILQLTEDFEQRKLNMDQLFITPVEPQSVDTMSLQLTLANRDQIDEVIEYLIVLGVQNIQHIEFNSSKIEEGKQASAIAAMQDAREKADFIASTEGKKIKGIFSIEYNPSSQIKIDSITMENITLEPTLVDKLLNEKISIKSNIRVNYKF